MEIDQNKIELLKWLAKTIGETAIAKMIEAMIKAGVDQVKLFGKAETEADLTPAQKYNAYVVGKFCKKEESSLVSEEALSQESVYIDAYIKHGENEPEEKILDRIDQWSQEDISGGVMLIHGEPGHGKTTLCRKAVYEFYRNRFGEKKTNVFWFRLNPAYSDIIDINGDLVLDNAFCWGDIKSQRKMIPLGENEDAYRGSIIFLDGYDELKVQAQSINVRLSDFINEVKKYAREYQIHFVVTARTRSVEDELYELEIPTLEFAPMTKEQQIDWIHKRKELQEYEEKFVKLRESSKEMKEMLGIPILFRMVVKAKLKSTIAKNVVDLYDTLFKATMERRAADSAETSYWREKYEQFAYEIYCNDEQFADVEDEQRADEFLYMFYIKGGDKQHVEFLHRSFYQYFLAHFLYRKMSAVENEAKAEEFLCCLAERRIDRDVLNYIQQIQKNKRQVTQEKCEQIINTLEQTGTVIERALKVLNGSGDAEKHPLLRCENVLTNALSICCVVATTEGSEFIISLHEKENIHTAMRRYNCSGIWLKNVDLSGANLTEANLTKVDLNVANLVMANLDGANLSGANLSGADLIATDLIGATLGEANLIGACLIGADLVETDLDRADLLGADLRWARNLDKCHCEQVNDWTGCRILFCDRNNIGLNDPYPYAYGITWCYDKTGDPIELYDYNLAWYDDEIDDPIEP